VPGDGVQAGIRAQRVPCRRSRCAAWSAPRIRAEISAFAGLLGKRIASHGVTVVDDGTLPDRRGNLTVDDEGTPTSRTVLSWSASCRTG
jgi:PmbA/TldA metallopeptidase C-terminal domain